ncbi:hypothetical protein BH18GEM1_BH18GEM1_01560 [soil metagenome]
MRPGHGEPVRDEIRLLDLGAILLEHWRLVLVVPLVAVLLAVLVFVFFPESYSAQTVLVPNAEEKSFDTQLAALAEQLPVNLDLLGGTKRNAEVIEAILESRSLADSIIERFDLKRLWDIETDTSARAALAARTDLQVEEEGAIEIEVEDDDPELAARIANAYPERLNRISARLSVQFAEERERFLAEQLARIRVDLEEAETNLVEFQRGNTAPAVEEQARATIRAAGQLQQQIMAAEMELAELSRFATPDNPQVRAARSRLGTLRAQQSRLTTGTGSIGDVFVALREAPELGVGFARLFRDYTEKQQIHALLTAGVAQARIDAARDLSIVSVLDPAIPPSEPSRPGLWVLIVLAGSLGIILGTLTAFSVEWAGRIGHDPDDRRFVDAWSRARGDWRALFRKRRT